MLRSMNESSCFNWSNIIIKGAVVLALSNTVGNLQLLPAEARPRRGMEGRIHKPTEYSAVTPKVIICSEEDDAIIALPFLGRSRS